MVYNYFGFKWIPQTAVLHLSKLKLPLNPLLCQHGKGALCTQSETVCIRNNTKDSPLFTKETILVYISPFSISNTWPLHLLVFGFSGNPGTCLFQSNQLFIDSVLS